MKKHEANMIAGVFLEAFAGGLRGMDLHDMVVTWLCANNVEFPEADNPSGEERDDAAEAEAEIVAAVKQAIADTGRRYQYRATQDRMDREQHVQRVQAVLDQFPLIYDPLDVNAELLTDALYGADL